MGANEAGRWGATEQVRHPFNPPNSGSLWHQYGINDVNCAVFRCDVGLDDGSAVNQNLAFYDLNRYQLTI